MRTLGIPAKQGFSHQKEEKCDKKCWKKNLNQKELLNRWHKCQKHMLEGKRITRKIVGLLLMTSAELNAESTYLKKKKFTLEKISFSQSFSCGRQGNMTSRLLKRCSIATAPVLITKHGQRQRELRLVWAVKMSRRNMWKKSYATTLGNFFYGPWW